jgi:hypothetical protein
MEHGWKLGIELGSEIGHAVLAATATSHKFKLGGASPADRGLNLWATAPLLALGPAKWGSGQSCLALALVIRWSVRSSPWAMRARPDPWTV